MKINLGCGRVYKKDYLNIDAYDDTVADEIQNATDLRFPDNSIERIEARQLIEHLGFVEAIYALCEWFRVLKPGGSLLIETPDLEASFRTFLKVNDSDKRDLLIWIYGIGTPGMKHGLCYPTGLLTELVKRTGFTDIENTPFVSDKNRQSVRITCRKPKTYVCFQMIAIFRKQLNKGKMVDVSDETSAMDLENIMDSLIPKVARYKDLTRIDAEDTQQIVAELALFNQKVATCFMEQLKGYREFCERLKELNKVDLPRVLIHLFKGMPIDPGRQKRTFKLVRDVGKEAVKKFIYLRQNSVLRSLSKTALEAEANQEESLRAFSEETLRRLSDRVFFQGIKEFILGKHDQAAKKFRSSILLFRDNFLSYINLARLMRILGNDAEAEKNYDNAIKLLSVFSYRRNSEIRRTVESERISRDMVREPLTSLDGFR